MAEWPLEIAVRGLNIDVGRSMLLELSSLALV